MKTSEMCPVSGLAVLIALIRIAACAQDLTTAKGLSRDLGSAPVPSDVSINGTIDQSIPARMAVLKREIRRWIIDKLALLPTGIDVVQLQKSILGDLEKAGLVASPDEHLRHPFGKVLGISVSLLPQRDLAEAIVSYDGYCPPDDSVLFLERRMDQKWHLLLNFDNTDFTHPWGIRELLYAGISPSDDKGSVYGIVVRTRSYCPGSGGGNYLNYFVLRPGADPESYQLLLSGEHSYRDDGDFRILLERNAFTLDFTDWSITPSFSRTHILKYAIHQDNVRRIGPVAVNPEGFIEEWMSSPWSLARDWSDPAQSFALGDWHEKLKMETGGKSDLLGSEAFRQTCSPEQKLTQISFPRGFPTTGPKSGDIFFVVRETDLHAYRLVNISRESALGCSEPMPDDTQNEHLLQPSLRRERRSLGR
jgi:hypothetical protein